MRHHLATLLEVIAVTLLGLMAGFFFAFAIDVVPAMAQLDASGYVTTQQWINKVVRNAGFGGAYFGSVIFPFLACCALLSAGMPRRAMAWFIITVVYFAAVFWVTRSVNVPINNELALWNATTPPANWAAARDTWNDANLTRSIAAALCFISSIILMHSPNEINPLLLFFLSFEQAM